jgi:glutathionylspermidine synthase
MDGAGGIRRLAGAGAHFWIEPAWKLVLSNKAILPLLWEIYPEHPNLLAASFDPPWGKASWVRKPMLGREGANITLRREDAVIETGGDYGEEGFVYQDLARIPCCDGMFPVVGSWVIGHEGNVAAGIGVRESHTPITTNSSSFVPHVLA